ncbi:uncharacterized protein ALTATR162_LOCUS6815 [Alternaria atra]|uniref:LysM domain-containing protein n=1 Tax=Alternaria atra TaxID=119953 RepID=A0A8J2I7H1_9PLEO|nr:uncharacterized protein ALTATR162_LOCUS6815 [Alternaria atra]CAG5165608.1 unnamed protein product [Alternaria atra]
MRLQASVLLCTLASAASAYLVDPPTTAAPDTVPNCSKWQIAEPGWSSCNQVASAWGLPIYQVGPWNPSCSSDKNFVPGNSYCVEVNNGPCPEIGAGACQDN